MLNEEDLEMGIPHSLIEDENGDTTLASDANSYGQNIAGANDADTYSSPTTLLDSERIHDVVDSASSTANVGQLPSDADVAVHDNHEARKFRVQDFIAGLLDANQSGEVDLGQVESIMMRVAVASNSAGASNRERVEDAARAPSSVVSTIQDGSESADADAEVSPLFADEHSTVSTHLSGLDGLTRDNIPPMTVEDEATSPWTLENAGTVPFSSVAEFEGVPQIQEEYYDVESPSSYHCDAADGNNLNSPFGESSPLFADDPATRNMTAASPFSGLFTGLEEADHEDVAPLPPGAMIQSIIDSQIEDGKMRGGLAQSDDHNDGPPAPADVENEFGGSSATRKMRGEVPEQVRDEDNGPDPFGTSATFEDANITEKVRGQATSNEHGLNDDAQLNPPLDVVETGSQLHSDNDALAITGNENEVPPQTNTADLGVSSPVDANQSNNGGTDTVGMGVTSSDIDTPSGDGNEVSNMAPARDVDQDGSILRIPEAYLVEPPDGDDRDNGEVVIATQLDPPVPFYKQKRVVCFLSVFMLIVIAIAAGVTSSLNGTPETVPELIAAPISSSPSGSPSNSIVPTTVRSSSPSSSPAPSYSPSSCVDTVSNGKQTLDMPLDSPDNIQVAIDGRNMVVVAKDTNLPHIYVVFYSLEDDRWVRKIIYPIKEYEHSNEYSVALSGSTALLGLGFAGTDAGERAVLVYVYKQDDKGVWNELQEPILLEDGGDENAYFGGSVDIDGNLACVATPHHVYVFRMDEDQQWAQIHRLDLDSDSCSVVGNTIAVRGYSGRWQINIYQFDEDLVTSVLVLQNTLPARSYLGAIALSANYLVYSTGLYYVSSGIFVGEEVFIYQRQDTNHPFVLHQSVTSSEFSGKIGHALALDEDILVIVGRSGTHVLSEQNGVFEKSLSLNQRYQSVQISGRSLIATTDEEVHAFAIDDCTQAVPTQTPSASSSPTTLPSSPPSTSTSPSELPSMTPSSSAHPSESSAPSMSPSLSVRPSASTSPTETCYWIDVSVVFDWYPDETSWDVERINDFGDNIVVKTYQGTRDDRNTLQKHSMCLEEGQYEFTIYDSWGNGLFATDADDDWLISQTGHYNVTSYGELIVEGGEFEHNETTSFSLPLSTAPSAMPSISFAPSMLPSSSAHPSESSAPSMLPSSSPSARPSASSSPTETCYWIDVSVVFDIYPDETSWDVERINDFGDNIVVKTYQGTRDDRNTLQKHSMCLEEGQYEFTIYDSWGDGLFATGHYNVTSYGELIIEGGEFEHSETRSFSLPLSTAPSAMPSISFAPSMSPSSSPSAHPSTSFSPTETCYWIDVSVVFDSRPTHTSWDVERINDFGDNIVVKTYNGISDDWRRLRKESMCLEEGQYQFTINDNYFNGNYNVTSYGELIVEGGEFENSETTSFSLPLSTAPSAMPSISFAPSMSSLPSAHPSESFAPSMLPSSSPSARPSASSSPTETCYWIDVIVLFDHVSDETSWDVERINDFRDNIVVKTYQGTRDDRNTLQKHSMCLEEGQYEFTIYDSRGNGLFAPPDDFWWISHTGHYNVTSYGELIVEGGEFEHSETTSFSLPLSTAPSAMP